ncbi:glycosyltransferase family 39 protein [Variovorax sp. Varisp85]|uniref:glycosyltransferase family 39 protein n=1 Tax=unclassified Variovorax TaxID=663243 RepID=UPI0002D87903|nr:glycosyltransferase family 39 protein [Variovorax sp. CF313]
MRPSPIPSAGTIPARAVPSPAAHRDILWALGAMLLLWTLSIAGFYPTPPWDNVEELFWGGSFEWSYYKHPPLPSWLMGVLIHLGGRQPWLTYAAGVGCGVGALYLVWRWSTALVHPARAALAVLLGSLVTYHVQRAVVYNHNTVQLLPLAGYWWMLWRVLHAPSSSRLRDWAWLGVFAALSMLTKYSAVVQFAVGAAFIVRQGQWRDAQVRRGLLLAGGVALLLMAPHLWWVLEHSARTIAYARHSVQPAGGHGYGLRHLVHVFVVQVARLSPMLLLAGWAWFTRASVAPPPLSSAATPGLSAFDRRFLAWATLGPACLVFPAAILLKIPLAASWLTTFFLPAALWAVAVLPGLEAERWSRRRWRGVVATVVVLHVAGALGQGWVDGVLSRRLGYITRANLPAGAVADALRAIWHDRAGDRPFRLLVGDTWFAGAVALKMDPSMQLLIDGDERNSPWLAPGALEREGGMVLILDTQEFRSEGALLEPRLAQADCRGTLDIPWAGTDERNSLRVRWGIVLPHGEHGAKNCGAHARQ